MSKIFKPSYIIKKSLILILICNVSIVFAQNNVQKDSITPTNNSDLDILDTYSIHFVELKQISVRVGAGIQESFYG